jgi:hypothetical protein
MEEYKYYCEKCDYGTNYKSYWNIHETSVKHQRNINEEFKYEPKKCERCNYTTLYSSNMKLHILNNHSTKEERKEGFKYYCEECDCGTSNLKQYEKHLEIKHT